MTTVPLQQPVVDMVMVLRQQLERIRLEKGRRVVQLRVPISDAGRAAAHARSHAQRWPNHLLRCHNWQSFRCGHDCNVHRWLWWCGVFYVLHGHAMHAITLLF